MSIFESMGKKKRPKIDWINLDGARIKISDTIDYSEDYFIYPDGHMWAMMMVSNREDPRLPGCVTEVIGHYDILPPESIESAAARSCSGVPSAPILGKSNGGR